LKKCNRCGIVKPYDAFPKDKSKKDGRHTICKECKSKSAKARYKPKPKDTSFDLTEIIVDGRSVPAKRCRGCLEVKPLYDFYTHKSCLGGVNSRCKKCMGIKGKYKQAVIEKIVYEGKVVEGKRCIRCQVLKPLTDFTEIKSKSRKGVGGRYARCKECEAAYRRELEDKNPEIRKRRLARSRLYTQKYKERKRELYHLNKEAISQRAKVKDANRWARKRLLRNDLTEEQYNNIFKDFDGKCALTGDEETTIEHFIPLITGHGGSYVGNVYPASPSLNYSKSGTNPFEWYKREDIQLIIPRERWDNLIRYLAKQNGMTMEEYICFVNWCFDNPRTVDDLKVDNTDSVLLFKRWYNERQVTSIKE
jgi:hypothetical protein